MRGATAITHPGNAGLDIPFCADVATDCSDGSHSNSGSDDRTFWDRITALFLRLQWGVGAFCLPTCPAAPTVTELADVAAPDAMPGSVENREGEEGSRGGQDEVRPRNRRRTPLEIGGEGDVFDVLVHPRTVQQQVDVDLCGVITGQSSTSM